MSISEESLISVIFDQQSSLSDKFDAVKSLESEEALAEVLLYSPSAEIRSYALSRVQDQDVLVKVVENDPNSTIRKFALEQVNSVYYELFEAVVLNDPDPLVRELAVQKMPTFYYKQFALILMHDPDSRVRHRASQRIRLDKLEQGELRILATTAVDPYIRRAATYSIEDQQILQEIAILGDDIQVIQHCLEQINSQDSLKTIVLATEFVSTQLEALPRIEDPSFIDRIRQNSQSPLVISLCNRLLNKMHFDSEN